MVTLKEFFSWKGNRFFWLHIAAMLVVLIGGIWGTLTWLDVYTHHGQSHIVPDVKSQHIAQAQALLESKQMKVVVIDSNFVKGLPAGTVLEQTPAGGARVKENRTIYLTINTLEVPKVKLPDLIDNSSVRQAAAKLKAMGFKLTEPELVAGEQDWVYGIKYKGRQLHSGESVPHEARLTLCIGSTSIQDSLRIDSIAQTGIQEELPAESEPEVDDSWF